MRRSLRHRASCAPHARPHGRRCLVAAGLVLVLALLVALAPLPGGAQTDEIEAAVRITTDSAQPERAFEAFDASAMAVFDLNGDGAKEIIVHNDNNRVYVFDAAGGLVAELETRHPDGWNVRELAGVAVGDVDGDERPELVVANSAAWVTVFAVQVGADGDLAFEKRWERLLDPTEEDPDFYENHPWVREGALPGLDGSVYLADATGDGAAEIFVQLDNLPSLYALDGAGGTLWWHGWSDGNANPKATDLTGDGSIEVAYPSDGGHLFLFDGASGVPRCTFSARDHGVRPASISVTPTAVDLTGDGARELVFGVRNAVEHEDDPDWFRKMNTHVFAVDADCKAVWTGTWDWANPHVHMQPVPVDVNGDGRLDVVFQDWNTIGHNPGDWQVTGPPNLFAVDGGTGALLWHVETTTFWSNKNLALADVTGDGDEELLVAAEDGGRDGIVLYDLDGERVGFVAAPSGWLVNRGPTAADLDGDGGLEIILPIMRGSDHCTRPLDVGCREGALQVYATPGEAEPPWPNVQLKNHVFDDAGLPASAQPPPEPVDDEPTDDEPTDDEPTDGGPAAPVEEEEAEPNPQEEPAQTEGEDTPAPPEEEEPAAPEEEEPAAPEEEEPAAPEEDEAVEPEQGEEPEAQSDGDAGDAAGAGGGGGGAAQRVAQETVEPPPRLLFRDFPAPDEPHDPMAPLVVHVEPNGSPVEQVFMSLDGEPLNVTFEGGRVVHEPSAPLPEGGHLVAVAATDAAGRTAAAQRPVTVDDGAPAEPVDPPEAEDDTERSDPRAGDGPPSPDDRADAPLPGALAVLAVAAVLMFVLRGRARRAR